MFSVLSTPHPESTIVPLPPLYIPGFLFFVLLVPSAGHAQDLLVTNRRTLVPDGQGGRVSWSGARKILAYDRAGSDGVYEVWRTTLDDTTGGTCITCSVSELGTLNKGNPEWDLSGNWLVLQVQDAPSGPGNVFGGPGVGVNNDIWAMDYNSNKFYKIRDTPQGTGGVLHPRFSHAGNKLLWSERIDPLPLRSGTWVMYLADFSVVNGVPSLTNLEKLTPGGATFYETHDFTPDDKSIIFSGTLEGQPQSGIDIYTMDLATRSWTNLTRSPNEWDEHAKLIPGLNKLMWMSSKGAYGLTPGVLKTEYWMMDLNGDNKNRLTWFNDPRGRNWYINCGDECSIVAADSDFISTTRAVAYLISGGKSFGDRGRILVMDLQPAASSVSAASFYRPPLAPDSYVTVFGTNLATTVQASTPPYPASMAGTTITVTDGQGTDRQAPLVFVSPNQVNYLIPEGTQPGPAQLTIRSGSGDVSLENLDAEEIAPALFSANSTGRGPAAAYVQKTDQSIAYTFNCIGAGSCDNMPVDLSGPDTYLVLYGTGIRNSKSVGVTIGGQPAQVVYAGPQGSFPGLDQINVILPKALAGRGSDVEIDLTVDGIAANPVTIKVQ